MHRKRRSGLPQSSRIGEKVLDYYIKFGKERELEKFMRFRSPSTTTGSASSSSEEWTRAGNLNKLFCSKEGSHEEPHTTSIDQTMPTISTSVSSGPEEHIIPIRLESGRDALQPTAETTPPESPKTPLKNNKSETKHTQTPESVAKVQKRLEWDSLGDVGYKKSKSTSNISIVERMLLREFFEYSSSSTKNTNSSENDIRLLEQEIAELGILKKRLCKSPPKHQQPSKCDTPPLASSTQVEKKLLISDSKTGAKPKVTTTGTSTSTLTKKLEKYAQTSLREPEKVSQEVQVTIMSSGVSSVDQSSFEYRSHPSTQSSGGNKSVQSSKQFERSVAGESQTFVKGLNDMLAQKKGLVSKFHRNQNTNETMNEECDHLKNLYNNWKDIIAENKENSSTTSCSTTTSNSPRIDLGIQLICAIMKAKSVDQRQKKRLVRTIVKQITRIANSRELEAIVSKTASLISESSEEKKTIEHKNRKSKKSVVRLGPTSSMSPIKSTISRSKEKSSNISLERTPISGNKSLQEIFPVHQNVEQPVVTLEETAICKSSEMPAKENVQVLEKEISTQPRKEEQIVKTTINTQKAVPGTDVIMTTDIATKNKKPCSSTTVTGSSSIISSSATASSSKESLSKLPVSIQFTVCVPEVLTTGMAMATITQQISSTTVSTTASGSSKNSIASKKVTLVDKRKKNSSAPAANMNEWLKPMTQSEIEYEGKKRSSVQDVLQTAETGKTSGSGRKNRLNWIEDEIERLQNLRHLLLKEDTVTSTTQTTDKLYDTVYSGNSRSKSRSLSGEEQAQKTTKDAPNITEKISKTDHQIHRVSSKSQVPKQKVSLQTLTSQRSKMDTPIDTQRSESVGSFVRQRKYEFLEHYKNQKLSHYDHMQHIFCEQPTTSAAAAAMAAAAGMPMMDTDPIPPNQFPYEAADPYAIPQEMQYYEPTTYYTYPPTTQQQQQRQDQCYFLPTENSPQSEPCYFVPNTEPESLPTRTTCVNFATQTTRFENVENSNKTQQQTSSSAFCVSSELSVPMGSSYGPTSTPTTTHQYDDVVTTTNAGQATIDYTTKPNVASQTYDSLTRSRPIYETRCPTPINYDRCMQFTSCTATYGATTVPACVQAKPESIAYSIQFISKSETRGKPNDGDDNSKESPKVEEFKTIEKSAAPSLQAALETGRPEFVAQVKKRKSILNRIQKMRQEREEKLRDLADNNSSLNSLDRKLHRLPPAATERLRIFPTKQMKAITNKHVAKLPEVLANKERERDERRKRGNRLLREVFNRRLQQRVRKGKLSLNHSRTII